MICWLLQWIELAATARRAVPAVAADPADRHPLADSPRVGVITDSRDVAGDLVTGRQGKLQSGQVAVDEGRVGVTDTARFDGNGDVSCRRLAELTIDKGEFGSCSGHFS